MATTPTPLTEPSIHSDGLNRERIHANGITFSVVVEGDPNGQPVLLLHGWPDSSALWRYLVPVLADAGFRVIAPDLRGCGDTDRPEDESTYAIANILADVNAILDHYGIDKAHVVGHDYGAVLSWSFAGYFPQRVDRLTVLSVGHPNTFKERSVEQNAKSFYVLLFQFRGVAETWLSQNDWAKLREWLASSPDVDEYAQHLARPGALQAALAWYRTNVTPESLVTDALPTPTVTSRTMALWGTEDIALTEDFITRSAEHVDAPFRYERFEGAGHWLSLERPAEVNKFVLDFLTGE
ncbi:alpha/beta fold hydrolase [Yinghuangia aomiensis]|uniref:Alpha/beta fold hydrolase n=1 Tax=Yinghuangia aomiensis TaxID=676205 RepID=A0ABP9HYI0_9ACTN